MATSESLQYDASDELGFPVGNPPTREHLHPVAPLARDLQDRLDAIMRGSG